MELCEKCMSVIFVALLLPLFTNRFPGRQVFLLHSSTIVQLDRIVSQQR
jgi:hypothetical protein